MDVDRDRLSFLEVSFVVNYEKWTLFYFSGVFVRNNDKKDRQEDCDRHHIAT